MAAIWTANLLQGLILINNALCEEWENGRDKLCSYVSAMFRAQTICYRTLSVQIDKINAPPPPQERLTLWYSHDGKNVDTAISYIWSMLIKHRVVRREFRPSGTWTRGFTFFYSLACVPWRKSPLYPFPFLERCVGDVASRAEVFPHYRDSIFRLPCHRPVTVGPLYRPKVLICVLKIWFPVSVSF